MARKRVKKRTHVGAKNPVSSAALNGHADRKDPKSMVIRIGAGEVGTSISQLATDVRRVMEPGTATRLKERKANRLRDYVTMCGPLALPILCSSPDPNLETPTSDLLFAPRGPTFNFRVDKYSLAKDVRRAQRHPKGGGKEYLTPPLLVMNNFTDSNADANSKVPKHLESITTTAFQSLFPPINPQKTPLKSIRRVLLLNREKSPENDGSFIINFRHYAITTKAVGMSKPLRRLNAAEKLIKSKSRKGGLPNLGKLRDISEFMIGGEDGSGYMTDGTSGSEYDTDAEIEILDQGPKKVKSAKARAAIAAVEAAEDEEEGHNDNVERRAVKLVELGPRMRLRMTKVEEGICSGKVLWHEYVHKTQEEIKELEKKWEQKRREKEARRKQQKANVEKKKAEKAAHRKATGGKGKDSDDEDEDMDMEDYPYDSDMYDSEGLAGDAEEQVNARMEQDGEWSDEEEDIAKEEQAKGKKKPALR